MRRKRGVLAGKMPLSSIIAPIGILPDGTPLYPIAGSTGPGTGQEDDDEGEDDEEQDEDDEEDESEKDKDSKKPASKRRKPAGKETPEAMKRRLNAEAREHRIAREAAEEELQKIRDKDKSELELAVRDRDDFQRKFEEVQAQAKDMGFELAFLRTSVEKGYQWDDAEYVMHKLQKQGLEFADGEVADLEETINELVKNKPSLLKSAGDDDDEGKVTSRTTGANPRTSRKKKVNSADEQARLAEKYGIGHLAPVR